MGYSESQANAFIDKMAPLMVKEGTSRGYKIISTAIAQAVIEGACGTSKLAKAPYFNHFGLKAGKAWIETGKPAVNMRTKEEYVVGHPVSINDYFRSYSSDLECVKGYYDFISTKRYANLKSAKNYIEYANMLKLDGYATSSTYVNTLCNTVRKYNLQRFDTNINVDIDRIAQDVIDGKYGSGEDRKRMLGNLYADVQKRVNEILKSK